MTAVKMLFSYNNNEKVVEVPVVPNELPEILQELNNTQFETTKKTLTLLGNKKPRSFSFDLFLPTKHYEFAKDTGTEILNLLGYVANKKIPMRIVITDGINELLNIAVALNSYKYKFDRNENIRCNVSFSEYMFLNNNTEDNKDVVVFQRVKTEIKKKFTTTTENISGVNVDGYNLVKARDVLEILGYEVGWNGERKRVTANGILLDIYTEIHNGSAYCYVRDLARATGQDIKWDSTNKTVRFGGEL